MPIFSIPSGWRATALFACAIACAAPGLAQVVPAPVAPTPSTRPAPQVSAEDGTIKARKLLDQMVQALGGEKWLALQTIHTEGRSASFYHGNPSGGYTLFFATHEFPDHDRIELTKKHDIVQIFNGRDAWEVTYAGRHRMEKIDADDFLRRRDHSIEQVVRNWLKQPGVDSFYAGQKMTDRHLTDEVTVLTANNDSVTLELDSTTHLPRRRTFYWRDPEYHDKNEESETYDDWHIVDGLPTSLLLTRYKNGDMTRQVYLSKVEYNAPPVANAFDVDATAMSIKK